MELKGICIVMCIKCMLKEIYVYSRGSIFESGGGGIRGFTVSRARLEEARRECKVKHRWAVHRWIYDVNSVLVGVTKAHSANTQNN